MINLVTVCGHNTTMLKHMLNHYKDMVDNIYVVAYISNDEEKILGEIKEITDEIGCGIYKVSHEKEFNWKRVTDLYNETKRTKPDEWWVVSDDDEFHVYPKPLNELINDCEENGHKFITGAFVDKIGMVGSFPKITRDSDVWDEFVLSGCFRYPISYACPNKTVVMKGEIDVTPGQHYALVGESDTYGDRWNHPLRYPIDKCFIQVHHFKWDLSVIRRLREVSMDKHEYTYHWEYRKMFDYILENGVHIDINDERFMIEVGSKKYEDYKQWDKIKELAIGFRQNEEIGSYTSIS